MIGSPFFKDTVISEEVSPCLFLLYTILMDYNFGVPIPRAKGFAVPDV